MKVAWIQEFGTETHKNSTQRQFMFECSNVIFVFNFYGSLNFLLFILQINVSKRNPFTIGDLSILLGKSSSSSWLLRTLQSKANTFSTRALKLSCFSVCLFFKWVAVPHGGMDQKGQHATHTSYRDSCSRAPS